jgi:transposase
MKYVGVDLHKKTISACVVIKERERRRVTARKRLECRDEAGITAWFRDLGKFEVVVEATSSYEWFVQLVEPIAHRVVLAHPKKLRVIAESKRKSDKLDAQVLAEFLASDEIPLAYRPAPRVREHRTLVRYREYLQRRITSVKNKLRHILAKYNADVPHLFTAAGQEHLAGVPLSACDRLVAEALTVELNQHGLRLIKINRELRRFAAQASLAEKEARAVLDSVPNIGPVTADIVLAELGDWRRFRSQADVAAYAGLAPGFRSSDDKVKQLGITKEGSRLLRWALVELAWRMVRTSRKWGRHFTHLEVRVGAKKAIVAIARRLVGMIFALLRSGQKYSLAREISPPASCRSKSPRDTNPSDRSCLRGQPRQARSLGAGVDYGGPLSVPGEEASAVESWVI